MSYKRQNVYKQNENTQNENTQTSIEKDNKLLILEKELASCKNTIDKLNMFIDILNKK